MQSLKLLRNPMAWGVGAIATFVVVALAAASLYVYPPGQQTVNFYTNDAASIRTGDEVRIAGIPVGKITDMSLEAERVRVQARVDGSVFVGDKSTIEIRMLTVVGGYFVDLIPIGITPLGHTPIAQERVTTPYSLIRAIGAATKITDNIATKPINQTLNELQSAMQGPNAGTLDAVIDAGNSVMSTIDRQRGQITKILDVTDEYIQRLSDFRETLRQMVRKMAIVEADLDLYSKAFGQALKGVGDIAIAAKTFGDFYGNHRASFLVKVREFLRKGRIWINHNGVIVRGLRDIQRHIERVLDVDQAPPELLASDLCIPMPGSPC